MKKDLQLKTIELRKLGYSVKELHKEISVSTSTISRWIQNVPLTKEARKRLDDRSTKARIKAELTIREKTKQKNIAANQFADIVVGLNTEDANRLMVLCAMIYHCEGNKELKSVTFTNSDPRLIQSFLFLFRKSFDPIESKFRVLMHLHDYHNEKREREFWAAVTQIPETQFNRSYRKQSDHRYKKEGYRGCVQIYYGDVSIARKLGAVAKTFMERYK